MGTFHNPPEGTNRQAYTAQDREADAEFYKELRKRETKKMWLKAIGIVLAVILGIGSFILFLGWGAGSWCPLPNTVSECRNELIESTIQSATRSKVVDGETFYYRIQRNCDCVDKR